MTSAELCRANGWKVGDVLERGVIKIKLTAIGEQHVLATRASDGERQWILRDFHNWHKVDTSTKGE